MTLDDEAQLIEEIAMTLASIGERENSDVLLYAEAGQAWAGGSVFISRDDQIVFIDVHDDDPLDGVMKLWTKTSPDKRWRGMTMILSGQQFRVEFDYGEGWSKDEDEGDRREPIVRAHFGDKPIYYPPLEGSKPWPEK